MFNLLPKPTKIVIDSIDSCEVAFIPSMDDFKDLYPNSKIDSLKNKKGCNLQPIFLYKNISMNEFKKQRQLFDGNYFVALQHTHYGHYINDIIGPFLYMRRFVPDIKLLLLIPYHSSLSKDHADSKHADMIKNLESMSIKYGITIEMASVFDNIQVENLYYWDPESLKKNNRYSYDIQYEMYDVIYKLLNINFSISNDKKEKVYIGRKHGNATNQNSMSPRYIKNEELVEEYFSSIGYKVCYLEFLTLEEQIHLFSTASKVVGFTGTGFTNVLWTDPNHPIDVVQLSSWTEYNDPAWQRIAESLNHNYIYIAMSNTQDAQKIINILKKCESAFL
jgi:hypothetical protein